LESQYQLVKKATEAWSPSLGGRAELWRHGVMIGRTFQYKVVSMAVRGYGQGGTRWRSDACSVISILKKNLFQFLIPSQATISTSVHILIIHFVRPVADLQHKLHNIGIMLVHKVIVTPV